ncbi:hypothetical protein HGH92_26045 [Chitinophaga varians]|uniref:DUF1579 domain-containing protein n=1 Tax=Chitinophaga varians TaxID=2202339 RepID=A0A847S0E3_9BACT|nr:hypothetical protein [Chitinophaga varians]NLR67794.1 hypothetical protein [Chitinophaga varians]
MKTLLTTLLLCFGLSATMKAQTGKQLPTEMVQFFLGNWTGEGAFASGKKIAADLSFKLSLDSAWIMYEHTDKAPNRYKALSMWGVDKQTGQLTDYIFDNFQGHRQFFADGWQEGKLTLTRQIPRPTNNVLYERFRYEKLSSQSFKMSYETSTDADTWKLVDYLTFTRK